MSSIKPVLATVLAMLTAGITVVMQSRSKNYRKGEILLPEDGSLTPSERMEIAFRKNFFPEIQT